MGRLVILSGPSCVGKGPLHKSLKIFFPEIAGRLKKVVLYDSRAPRPGEADGVDFHFRTREYIEQLRGRDNFLVTEVRGDLQALDLNYLRETIAAGNAFFEGNPIIGMKLMELTQRENVACLSVFLSPLSMAEIEDIRGRGDIHLETMLRDMMRQKLLRRTKKQKGTLSPADLEDIERRAGSAYKEMKEAWRYDFVIPNGDGEDSENWDSPGYPAGDAKEALLCFAEILSGGSPAYARKWPQGLLP
jgi:guanylate kinase